MLHVTLLQNYIRWTQLADLNLVGVQYLYYLKTYAEFNFYNSNDNFTWNIYTNIKITLLNIVWERKNFHIYANINYHQEQLCKCFLCFVFFK